MEETNDGALKNTGFDVNVNAMIVQTKNWRWQAGFSVGHYKNEITELPTSDLNFIKTYALDENGKRIESSLQQLHGYTSSIYGSNNVLTAVGQAAGVFYGYKTSGVFTTDVEAKKPTPRASRRPRAFSRLGLVIPFLLQPTSHPPLPRNESGDLRPVGVQGGSPQKR